MSMQKLCPNCHKYSDSDAMFCQGCGTSLSAIEPAEIEPVIIERIKCPHCGTVVGMGDKFCAVCGTVLHIHVSESNLQTQDQPVVTAMVEPVTPALPVAPQVLPINPQPTSLPHNQQQARPMEVWSAFDSYSKMGLVGAGCTLIAVFVASVRVLGIGISLTDISMPSAVVIILFSLLLAYNVLKRQFDMLPACGTGFIILTGLSVIYYMYVLNKMKSDVFGKLAAQGVGLGGGLVFLFVGGVLMIYAGIKSRMTIINRPSQANDFLTAWKDALTNNIKLGNVQIPAVILTICLVCIVVLLVLNAKIF